MFFIKKRKLFFLVGLLLIGLVTSADVAGNSLIPAVVSNVVASLCSQLVQIPPAIQAYFKGPQPSSAIPHAFVLPRVALPSLGSGLKSFEEWGKHNTLVVTVNPYKISQAILGYSQVVAGHPVYAGVSIAAGSLAATAAYVYWIKKRNEQIDLKQYIIKLVSKDTKEDSNQQDTVDQEVEKLNDWNLERLVRDFYKAKNGKKEAEMQEAYKGIERHLLGYWKLPDSAKYLSKQCQSIKQCVSCIKIPNMIFYKK